MISKIVSFNNVSKGYKAKNSLKQIFENISLDIKAGERIGIVGANASGKSTFLKLLLKQESPDGGDVSLYINGDKISYLPQDYRNALFPWLTVRDNFALLLNGRNNSKWKVFLPEFFESKIRALFEKLEVKIQLEKFPYQLSGGEQQILLLVQSIVRNPVLFVGDEALSAVDFHKRELVLNYFSSWIQENKITSVLVSHDIEEAVYLSDRIIILSKGDIKIREDFGIDIPFPREQSLRHDKQFLKIIQHIKDNFE